MKKPLIYIFALLLLLPAQLAYGCVMLEKGDPKVGSSVSVAPERVTLTFSDRIYPAQSTLVVTDAQKNIVSVGKPFGYPHDSKLISINLRAITSGIYKVSWQIYCDCHHLTPGTYKFTVQ